MATASPPHYLPILLRSRPSLVPHIPADYQFLAHPPPRSRINFRHPAYPDDDNIIFTLHAWDHPNGGIHHGLAHNACAIVADNHWDGYLSTSRLAADRVAAGWDEALPSAVRDYYFLVPTPGSPCSLPPGMDPYRWPVVPTFQDWRFPPSLPDVWERCAQFNSFSYPNTAAQSTFSDAIHRRDIVCRVTAFQSACEAAHLIPDHESRWFQANNMAEYNNDFSLEAAYLLSDLGNAVLLRKDIHHKFDERAFVFFPKHREGLVMHMLSPTPDIGPLYHNSAIDLSQCRLEFIFARFAWAIFPSLTAWIGKAGKSRYVVHTKNASGERAIEEVENGTKGSLLNQKAAASRSNSPTKRSRIAAQLDEEEEEDGESWEHRGRKRFRQSWSSNHGTTDNNTGASPARHTYQTPATMKESAATTPASVSDNTRYSEVDDQKHVNAIKKLRKEAIAQQRPHGFDAKRPPYDPHRPAAEELERMGIEIISDSFDDDDNSVIIRL